MSEQINISPPGVDMNENTDSPVKDDSDENEQVEINDLTEQMDTFNLDSNSKISETSSQNFPQKTLGGIEKVKSYDQQINQQTGNYTNFQNFLMQNNSPLPYNQHNNSTLSLGKSQTSNLFLNYFDESLKYLSNLQHTKENPLENNFLRNSSKDNEQNPSHTDNDFFTSMKNKFALQEQEFNTRNTNTLNEGNNFIFANQNNISGQLSQFDNNQKFYMQNYMNSNRTQPSFNTLYPQNPFMPFNPNNINDIPQMNEINNIQQQIQKLNPEDYLFEKFGKRGWQCIKSRQNCNRCGLYMIPKIISKSKRDEQSSQEQKRKKPLIERRGDWVCPKCRNLNFAFRLICNRCQLPKNAIDSNSNKMIMNMNMNNGQFAQNFLNQQNQKNNYIDPKLINKNINIFNKFYSVGTNQKPTFSLGLNSFEQNNRLNYLQSVPQQAFWNNIIIQNNFNNQNNNIQYNKSFDLMNNNNLEERD